MLISELLKNAAKGTDLGGSAGKDVLFAVIICWSVLLAHNVFIQDGSKKVTCCLRTQFCFFSLINASYLYVSKHNWHSWKMQSQYVLSPNCSITFCFIFFVFIIFCNKVVEIFKLFNICESWSAPILFLNIPAEVAQGLPWVAYLSNNQTAN